MYKEVHPIDSEFSLYEVPHIEDIELSSGIESNFHVLKGLDGG
jgi:hypothetical protein